MKQISFNRPSVVGNELQYLKECFLNGHVSGNGLFTKRCEEFLEKTIKTRKAFLTTSCTHSLEMSALLLDLSSGDEVILPSFTFPSTANAFALRGVTPVFVDIRADTLNLDETIIERLITPKTKAIVVVHYAGVGCKMDEILRIARRHKLALIEDNAHGLFGKYKGKNLGTFGMMATQSFHETKNFSCGEGGALFVNDDEFIERAEIIREKGTDRSKFFRGEVDKYSWIDLGSSYVLSELQAAFLFAQFEMAESIQNRRRQLWLNYKTSLEEWAGHNGVKLPFVPEDVEQPFHLFYLCLPSLQERQRMIDFLGNRGIQSLFHYQPLHLSRMGRSFGAQPGDCPVAEQISETILRLPLYTELTDEEQGYIIRGILEFEVEKSALISTDSGSCLVSKV